jgi:hypothetical protein
MLVSGASLKDRVKLKHFGLQRPSCKGILSQAVILENRTHMMNLMYAFKAANWMLLDISLIDR